MRTLFAAILLTLVIAGCSSEPQTAEELKKAGNKAFLAKDYAKARTYFLEALQKKPSDKDLLYFTGMSYKRDFILDSALIYLKKADLLHPDDREINMEIYDVAMTLGEWKYADLAIRTFIRTGDPESMYYRELADIATNMGNRSTAFYYLYKQYDEIGLQEAQRFSQLAGLAADVDSIGLAYRILDSAVTRFGQSDVFEMTRAKILFDDRKLTEAEALLRKLSAKYPDEADISLNLANALANQKSPAKKREALDMYRRIRPSYSNPALVDSIIANVERQLDGEK
jgi:tetratricopeptide (TPR) repeat protein